MKPFKQIPSYKEDATIAVPIKDFIELQNFLKFFAQPFGLVQNAYHKAINDGVITFSYKEEDGTEITEDEARKRVQEYNASANKA